MAVPFARELGSGLRVQPAVRGDLGRAGALITVSFVSVLHPVLVVEVAEASRELPAVNQVCCGSGTGQPQVGESLACNCRAEGPLAFPGRA